MKLLIFAILVVSAALLGTPADAHVVHATSSLSLSDIDVDDKPQLEKALKAAVDTVLAQTIAFKPTFIALTDAQVIGSRLYFRVLIADEDGERTLEELIGGGQRTREHGTDPGPDSPAPSEVRLTI
jgi:hypothetical protein